MMEDDAFHQEESHSIISSTFVSILSKQEDVHVNALGQLTDYVSIKYRELNSEHFITLLYQIDFEIKGLLRMMTRYPVMCAISVLNQMLSIEKNINDGPFIYSWIIYLSTAMSFPDDINIVFAACECFGRYASVYEPILNREFINKRLISSLDRNHDIYRVAGDLAMMNQVFANVPNIIDIKIIEEPSFVNYLMNFLLDTNDNIRNLALDVLKSTCCIILNRHEMSHEFYKKIIDFSRTGLANKNLQKVQGSIEVIGTLLECRSPSETELYSSLCSLVLDHSDSKNLSIRATIINELPKIASYSPELFCDLYLNRILDHLLKIKKKGMNNLFLCVGKLSLQIYNFVNDEMIERIIGILNFKKIYICDEYFMAISMVSEAFGTKIFSFIQITATQLCESEIFSKRLIDMLKKISEYMPINENILEYLSSQSALILDKSAQKETVYTSQDVYHIILSLDILVYFEFTPELLEEFLSKYLKNYLRINNSEIRTKSGLTSSIVLRKISSCGYSPSKMLLVDTLTELTRIIFCDNDDSVRLKILESFDPSFDKYLCEPQILNQFLLLLNDSVLEIQLHAILFASRIQEYNPAYIIPALRQLLIQNLNILRIHSNIKLKESCTKILCNLIYHTPSIVYSYSNTIMDYLIVLSKSSSISIVVNSLRALGDMSKVDSQLVINNMDRILKIVIDNIQDKSSSIKRNSALKTLGDIIEGTGFVIEPFVKFPMLMDSLLEKLVQEKDIKVQCDIERVIGIIGALDPYVYNQFKLKLLLSQDLEDGEETMRMKSTQNEYFFHEVALFELLKLLKRPYGYLFNIQKDVIKAIFEILEHMGTKCVPYIENIIPPLMKIMGFYGLAVSRIRKIIIREMGTIVECIGYHTKLFLKPIMTMIKTYWDRIELRKYLVILLEKLSLSLKEEFKPEFEFYLPEMLLSLQQDIETEEILHALIIFGSTIESFLHIVIPTIISKLRESDIPSKIEILKTISDFSVIHDLSPYTIILLRMLTKLLTENNQLLVSKTTDVLCDIIICIGRSFEIYKENFDMIFATYKLDKKRYTETVQLLLSENRRDISYEKRKFLKRKPVYTPKETEYVEPNFELFVAACRPNHITREYDWLEWKRNLTDIVIQESPFESIKACRQVAKIYYPMAKMLFNSAFVSIWVKLPTTYHLSVILSIEMILESETIPQSVLNELLDLLEYTELYELNFPVNLRKLALSAEYSESYAKALHFIEMQFRKECTADVIGSIISINDKLGMYDSGHGIVKYATVDLKLEIHLNWYNKLQRWVEVNEIYDTMLRNDPGNMELIIGKMYCLTNLGEFVQVLDLAKSVPSVLTEEENSRSVELQMNASMNLMRWEELDILTYELNRHTFEGSFYRSIIQVYNQNYDKAQKYISRCRYIAATELTSTIGESYQRSYGRIVRFQQLTELEEIIKFNLSDHNEKDQILRRWELRLNGIQGNVEIWQGILSIRSVVLPPEQNLAQWTKLAKIANKNRRPRLAKRILSNLIVGPEIVIKPGDSIPNNFPLVKYAYLKILWREMNIATRREALDNMMMLVNYLEEECMDRIDFLSKCYYKSALWTLQLNQSQKQISSEAIQTIFDHCQNSIALSPDWDKSWHIWGISNYTLLTTNTKVDEDTKNLYLRQSLEGLFNSIRLSPEIPRSIQDTLRLLTLWYSYSKNSECIEIVSNEIQKLNIETWLHVIPQLISRMHIPMAGVYDSTKTLLLEIGKCHPQSIVFPLIASMKVMEDSPVHEILDDLGRRSEKLVREAKLITNELNRLSNFLQERLYKKLERVIYLCNNQEYENVLETLRPIYDEIILQNNDKHTAYEKEFINVISEDLQKAWDNCLQFKDYGRKSFMAMASDLFSYLLRLIKRQVDFDSLKLELISPVLMSINNSSVAIPGTYIRKIQLGDEIGYLHKFCSKLQIIKDAKQKPRKFSILGNDGVEHPYLLKGNEDLRQDERVMQLFQLLNTVFKQNTNTTSRLRIESYSVTPLSPFSGILSWVKRSDTIHKLVFNYRKMHNIDPNKESEVINIYGTRKQYAELPVFKKLEIFEEALTQTPGNDLERLFWLNSSNSEVWLDRRSEYIKSLAVMSMVGYVLGLGDRHPNNLMINRLTGRVIHVDFGDCFEVAMNRENMPEIVPFRLTRMLVKAMEVCGVDGIFKITCEEVMDLLRSNRDSIMAVLDTFVYDPLITWKKSEILEEEEVVTKDQPHIEIIEISPTQYYQVESIGSLSQYANEEAMGIIERVSSKLNGNLSSTLTPAMVEYLSKEDDIILDVDKQVNRLINEAKSNVNLCQLFLGWCPYW